MKTSKKLNQTLTRNLIISSVVWACVILACSLYLGSLNKQMNYILIAGFFIEFLRITSLNKSLKKDYTEEVN